MAALDFPASPSSGTVYGKYTWDGEKWGITPTAAGGGITQADADLRYVDVAGDTMTGHLTLPITPAAANAVRKDYVDTAIAGTVSKTYVDAGDAAATTAATNANTNANTRVAKAGDTMTGKLTITDATASSSKVTGALVVTGGIGSSGTVNGVDVHSGPGSLISDGNCYVGFTVAKGGQVFFGNDASQYLKFDPAGNIFGMVGGQFRVNSDTMFVGSGGAAGYYHFGNTGTAYLGYNGTRFQFFGGTVYAPAFAPPMVGGIISTGYTDTKLMIQCGTAGIQINNSANTVDIAHWADNLAGFWNFGPAYKPGGGAWGDSSDARIKDVTGDYSHGLAEVLTLNPKTFTFKGNDTFADTAPSNYGVPQKEEDGTLKEDTEPVVVPFANSPHYDAASKAKEFIGLIAQECEAAFPEMVSKRAAMIDGVAVTDMRDLDTTPLIFALVNAIKELTARIEVLEGVS